MYNIEKGKIPSKINQFPFLATKSRTKMFISNLSVSILRIPK